MLIATSTAATAVLDAELQLPCFAVKVRSAGEEGVARALRQKGHEVLLPVYTVARRYSDRIKKATCALFPGYIFVRMDPDALLNVVSTNGVSYVVRSGRTLEPLSEDEIRTVETLCRTPQDCEPCDYVQVGQRVMIESGLFAGLTGVLEHVHDENRVVIAIDSLHQAVRIAIGCASFRVL